MALLTNVLNDEERDNLAAALKRRPVVKTGRMSVPIVAAAKIQSDVPRFQTLPTVATPEFHFLLDTAGTAVLVPAGAR